MEEKKSRKNRRFRRGDWGSQFNAKVLASLAGLSVPTFKLKLYELRDLKGGVENVNDFDLGALITDCHLKKRLSAINRQMR